MLMVDLCRRRGPSSSKLCKLKAKYAGMEVSETVE